MTNVYIKHASTFSILSSKFLMSLYVVISMSSNPSTNHYSSLDRGECAQKWMWFKKLGGTYFMNFWLAACIFAKLYHRANSCLSLRPIARFAKELQHFVCNPSTPPIIEKLWSKGVTIHIYNGISVYYTYTRSQLNGHGWSYSK